MRAGVRPRGLLIDFDRTLVDLQSHTDYPAAAAALDSELGPVDLVDVPATGWRSETHRAMATLVALVDHPERWRLASEIIERFELAAVGEAIPMPGLQPFLAMTAGVPRAIVTLLSAAPIDAACHRFGIGIEVRMTRRPDVPPKPSPEPVLAACSAIDEEPAAVAMVGDSSWDEAAAAAAGVWFIGVGADGRFGPQTVVAPDLVAAGKLLGF